jgi:FkbM family methyltransferase
MRRRIKGWLARMGEAHPITYWLSVAALNRTDLFLPHETDYLAFPLLARTFAGTILDVGANQGHSARAFAKLVNGRQIVSIEANSYHRPTLERLQRRLPQYSYHIAAADKVGGRKIALFTPIYRGIAIHCAAAAKYENAVDCIRAAWPRQLPAFRYVQSATETIAIDDLDLPVGIVKMDIQGKELGALQGCCKTIERRRPAFLIEVFDERERICAFFLANGYRPFNYDHGRRRFSALEDRVLTRNLFFLPTERCGAVLAAAG